MNVTYFNRVVADELERKKRRVITIQKSTGYKKKDRKTRTEKVKMR